MLNEETKQEIRKRYEAIGTAIPNFRSRGGQRLMIAEIAKTLARCPDEGAPVAGSTVLCVQGGTGLGKSVGYALSGIIMSRLKNKKLVISSATVALQEQLTRDLPLFLKACGLDATVELAKGRTRYVCLYRLAQVTSDLKQVTMFGREQRAGQDSDPSEEMTKAVETMAKDYNESRWDGDRDSRGKVDDTLWSSITTNHHGCLARNCPSFRSCAQFAARKRLKEATIIVANHDLVLSDLAMGGGRILPKPEETFYVFDEAHHLPGKAVSIFASSHLVHADQRMLEKVDGLGGALSAAIGTGFETSAAQIEDIAETTSQGLADALGYFSSLVQLRPTETMPRPTLEFQNSCIPEEFFSIGANIRSGAKGLIGHLKVANEMLTGLMGSDQAKQALYEKLSADAGFYLGRLEEIETTWRLFLEEPALDLPPIAKWIETVKSKSGIDYQMCASPVLAAGYLRSLLWEKAAGAILASATMTTLGGFDDFLRRSGLSTYAGVQCIDLPSPFDYAQQGTIEIAKMTSSPKDYAGHTKEVVERISTLLAGRPGEGSLVLFTSRRQMEEVAGKLPSGLSDCVLMQGSGSKVAIIKEHMARIDGGKASIILGLDSFSEGVDLVGNYCTHVVVVKLPFAVPDNPVLRTLSDWIEQRGGNAFMEISVPDAARKLEQSVGRLIRTETDRGTITVLDSRLWNSRYGRMILRGLPPFRVIAMGKEVTP